MSSNTKQTASTGSAPLFLLFLLFLGLKLADKIDWSWWWVTAPLWIPFALVGVVTTVLLAVWAAAKLLNTVFNR